MMAMILKIAKTIACVVVGSAVSSSRAGWFSPALLTVTSTAYFPFIELWDAQF